MNIDKIISLCTTYNMSLAELYDDSQFNKIPKGKIDDYIIGAINIAKLKANKIKNENKSMSLIDICKSKGVTVNILDKDYIAANVHYRAEIYYLDKSINIMKSSIVQMCDQLTKLNLFYDRYDISYERVVDIHVAHELYHLIEYIDKEETGSLLPKVTSIKVGRFERKSEVVRTSEVAAHIFCMEILNLPFHPKLLDYLYLLSNGEVTEDRLVEFLYRIENEASCDNLANIKIIS